VIFDNPDPVKKADTLEALAAMAGLPAETLTDTVRHYNEMVEKGVDADFGRFGPGKSYEPRKIGRTVT
jgi:hypothetical protein